MREYQLSCCSTADMPSSFFAARNIAFACFHYEIDGKQYPDDLGKTMSFEEFYARIAKGAMPTTSQVNVDQFLEMFTPALEAGKDILHISFSSGLSGSYNSARLAVEELQKKYPDRKLCLVDSLSASSGYGLFVDRIADLRDGGATIEEAYQWAMDNRLTVHHWFFTSDLSHLKRGGRVSAASAMVGTILNICPLMNVSNEGKLIPRRKVRGKRAVITEAVNEMERHAQGGLQYNQKCFISHSSCLADARLVADEVEKRFPKLDGRVLINDIGTVVGSHTGRGTVALYFFGDPRVD